MEVLIGVAPTNAFEVVFRVMLGKFLGNSTTPSIPWEDSRSPPEQN